MEACRDAASPCYWLDHIEKYPEHLLISTFLIAGLTFREAASRKVLLAAMLLGIVFLLVFGIGYNLILSELEKQLENMPSIQLNEFRNFLLMAAIYVVNFLVIMMAVLTSVDTLSGEISSGTIQTIVSKPIQRREIVAGKWLGFTIMITLYLLMMAGGVILIVYLRSRYLPPNPVLGMVLIWMNAILMLSVSILGGTRLSTLANGVLVFGLYGVAFIGGWIEQIGSFLPDVATRQTTMNIGVITSLILPSEALWKRAAYELQSPLVSSLGISPFAGTSYPSNLMIGYAGLFILSCLLLAIWSFNRRDL